ncbi:tetratricopeptide repeat protein [Tardiphaga sp. 71_E8_N1_1]|uniref:tetratricopeptide repeat protein n=1 Tax=Tardiphaga sp. 71_E8_N1_1 TaxID=3240784 RepID=UPI003F8C1841
MGRAVPPASGFTSLCARGTQGATSLSIPGQQARATPIPPSKLNRLELSLADYSAGAQHFPNNGIFPNGQGLVLTNQGKFPEAIARFDEAIKLDPTSPVFQLGRAEAYNRSERPRKALDDYEEALSKGRLVPRDMARLRVGRGYANLKLNNCPVAIDDFNAALELSPRFANALKWRGLCLEKMGQIDSAIREYEAALKVKPSDSVLAERLQTMRTSK